MLCPKVLLIDLNNFSRYPTLSVGYLAAVLRAHGIGVTVFSPFAHGVQGVDREPSESHLTGLGRRLNYALEQAEGKWAARTRGFVRKARQQRWEQRYPTILGLLEEYPIEEFDAVLVSTYLMYYPVCFELGRRCERAGVPLLIGGSYFANREVAESWLDIPGLSALVGGEVELELVPLIHDLVQGKETTSYLGVWTPNGRGQCRPPLVELDRVPFPDFSDFPWERYPHRIIPMITGRGCGWGACTFCSDVTSTAGRTYRTRSPENVLDEAEFQSQRFDTRLFIFTDLKLNSDLTMWEAIHSGLNKRVPNPRWIGSVHVESAELNGLDLESLKLARASGAVRLTTGLESGSQSVLDRWAKGTDLATTSRFLVDASKAEISVRVTMIHGAPEETPEDVQASADFLLKHRDFIDRVSLNRFQMMIGTTFDRRHVARPSRNPSIIMTDRQPKQAQADHFMRNSSSRKYALATQRLLTAVHSINSKPLPNSTREFIGVM